MVVYYHFVALACGFSAGNPLSEFFLHRGMFGVDVFFVISGFIMVFTVATREYAVRRFLANRFARIAPAYWFATLLLIGLAALLPRRFITLQWTPSSLAESLAFLPPSHGKFFPVLSVGWTLNLEAFFYAALGVCLLFGRRVGPIACAALLFVLPLTWPPEWPFAVVLASPHLHRFVAGMLVGYAFLHGGGVRRFLGQRPYASLAVFAIPLVLLQLPAVRAALGSVDGISGVLVLLSALSLEPMIRRWHPRVLRPLAHLGDVSYSTYLLHVIVLHVVIGVGTLAVAGAVKRTLAAVGFGVVTYLASALSYRYIERSPVVRRVRERLAGE